MRDLEYEITKCAWYSTCVRGRSLLLVRLLLQRRVVDRVVEEAGKERERGEREMRGRQAGGGTRPRDIDDLRGAESSARRVASPYLRSRGEGSRRRGRGDPVE